MLQQLIDLYYQIIKLPNYFPLKREKIDNNLPYVNELLKIYSNLNGTSINTIEELKKYPNYEKHFKEQRICYYSAEAIKQSIKDLFIDGEEYFNILKNEIFDSFYETYVDFSLDNGYQRLKNVLEIVSKANLNSSLILNVKGLITTKEKKGICHILGNEGRIKSWINVDY